MRFLTFLLTFLVSAQAFAYDTDPTKDQVLFDIDDDALHSTIVEVGDKCGLDLRLNSKHSDPANIYIADVPEGGSSHAIRCVSSHVEGHIVDSRDWIESAEENFEMKIMGKPNDPLYQFQWNFDQVEAEDAWKVTRGKGVVVAVIDTGVAMEKDDQRGARPVKDLEGTARVDGYDFVDDDDTAWDGHGHGTHVAGTIAQTTGNKYGVAGLAYEAEIMPLRVLNSSGFGSVADIVDAIRFAADNGAQVINMSLGGPLPSLTMANAVKYAYKKGVTVVAAAGNGGKRAPSYPAAYKHAVAVSATQYDRSTTFYSQWGSYVDIAAPGGNTRVDQNDDGRPDGVMQETLKEGSLSEHEFALYMGTSMASPHVAAGAAMLYAQGVTHPDKVEAALVNTASDSERDDFDSEKEYRERYGGGIMQVDNAVQVAGCTQGGFRLGFAMLLSVLCFGRLRKRDILGIAPSTPPLFMSSLLLASSGLFFVPLIMGDVGWLSFLTSPISELDLHVLGVESHQNMFMASMAIPAVAVLFTTGSDKLKYLGSGLAIGFAGFLFSESILMTSDVLEVPGMGGVLDRIWLFANGLVSLWLGYLTLKRY